MKHRKLTQQSDVKTYVQMLFQQYGRPFLRALLIVVGLCCAAMVLVGALIVGQSRRDETRPVDAIAVILYDSDREATLERAGELYRRRYARRLLLVGVDPSVARANLVDRGIPEPALLLNASEATGPGWEGIYNLARLAHQHEVQTVLIVSPPDALLLNLKMARDVGLSAFGAPVAPIKPAPAELLKASLAYWMYVLLGPDVLPG